MAADPGRIGGASEAMLALVMAGLAVYFSVLLVRGTRGYLRFRRLRPTAIVTWRAPRPAHTPFLLVLGVVALGVAGLQAWFGRPFHHVYAQLATAAYFIVLVPLCGNIRLGLYRDGVWADAGFLAYRDIGRMAFREGREIVLTLLPRGRTRPFRLLVPPDEYGAVRKLLDEKIRQHVLTMEKGILGL
jgi:hypothetical protein